MRTTIDFQEHLDTLSLSCGIKKELEALTTAYKDRHYLIALQLSNGKIFPCARKLNSECDEVDFETWDEAVMALPHIIDEKGLKLYGDPPALLIAGANPKGFGLVPYKDWDFWIERQGYNLTVMRKIKNYLKAHPPIDYDVEDAIVVPERLTDGP